MSRSNRETSRAQTTKSAGQALTRPRSSRETTIAADQARDCLPNSNTFTRRLSKVTMHPRRASISLMRIEGTLRGPIRPHISLDTISTPQSRWRRSLSSLLRHSHRSTWDTQDLINRTKPSLIMAASHSIGCRTRTKFQSTLSLRPPCSTRERPPTAQPPSISMRRTIKRHPPDSSTIFQRSNRNCRLLNSNSNSNKRRDHPH
jgi:hypothetical protein